MFRVLLGLSWLCVPMAWAPVASAQTTAAEWRSFIGRGSWYADSVLFAEMQGQPEAALKTYRLVMTAVRLVFEANGKFMALNDLHDDTTTGTWDVLPSPSGPLLITTETQGAIDSFRVARHAAKGVRLNKFNDSQQMTVYLQPGRSALPPEMLLNRKLPAFNTLTNNIWENTARELAPSDFRFLLFNLNLASLTDNAHSPAPAEIYLFNISSDSNDLLLLPDVGAPVRKWKILSLTETDLELRAPDGQTVAFKGTPVPDEH